MKNIYLHIGTMKTGSTAIQNFLRRNQILFSKYDFAFYIAHDFYFQLYNLLSNARNADTSQLRDNLINTIDGFDQNNIIISCEEFYGCDIGSSELYSDVFSKFFSSALKKYNVQIIFYMRRQDLLVESLYVESIFCGFTLNFNKFCDHIMNCLSYAAILDSLVQYFSLRDIIIRIYEKDMLYRSDSIDDFLQSIGIDAHDFLLKAHKPTSDKEKNTKLALHALRIAKYYNKHSQLSDNEFLMKQREYFSDTLSHFEKYIFTRKLHAKRYGAAHHIYNYSKICNQDNVINDDYIFFTQEERIHFLDNFAESNRYVAKRYLRKSDGDLFQFSFPDGNVENMHPSTTDVIDCIFPMIRHLDARIRIYDKKIREIEIQLDELKKYNSSKI